jgi:hypothetical protein
MSDANHPIGFHIGQMENSLGYSLPLIFPDLSGGICVIYEEQEEGSAICLIESVVLQYMEQLPVGEMKIEVFDHSIRKSFPTLSKLKSKGLYSLSYDENEGSKKFADIQKTALKRHHEMLDFSQPTMVLYNALNRYKEEYYFLLINLKNFPYSFQSTLSLKDFFDAAQSAGIYIIAYGDKEMAKAQYDAGNFLFTHLPMVEVSENRLKIYPHETIDKLTSLIQEGRFTLKPNLADTDVLVASIMSQCKQEEIETEEDFLSIPIGLNNDGRTPLYFSLGKRSDVYNAIITGRAGSGKTVLLNNLILGIAQKYDASQLRLYLMDYKQGVEFQVFENHPNCEKIFLDNSDIDAAHTLIDDFVGLIEERGELCRQLEVSDIYGYNKKNSSEPMQWVILIVDEVQRLFDGHYTQTDKFNKQLTRVVREGRGFGIHIIFSTQTLVGVNISSEIMSLMTLRISLKLNTEADADKMFEYGNRAPLKLNRYEVVYNPNGGQTDSNQFARINPPDDIREKIKQILANRSSHLCIKPVVITTQKDKLNMSSQPILSQNSVKHLLMEQQDDDEVNNKIDEMARSNDSYRELMALTMEEINKAKGGADE